MRSEKTHLRDAVEHVTTKDIFGDLGFPPEQSLELAVKSDLHRAIVANIRANGMTQAELVKALGVHQPDVSNLLRGKLGLFSISKLCQYAERLNLKILIEVRPITARTKKRALKKQQSIAA